MRARFPKGTHLRPFRRLLQALILVALTVPSAAQATEAGHASIYADFLHGECEKEGHPEECSKATEGWSVDMKNAFPYLTTESSGKY